MKHVNTYLFVVVVVSFLGLVSWSVFWIVPTAQTVSRLPVEESSVLVQIELVKTMAQIALGVVVLGTLYVGWRRADAAERTVEVAREGQITERFTRAVDQLGSGKPSVRLGGVYALERIARDSVGDRWPVMQVLMDSVPRGLRWDLEMTEMADPREQLEEPVAADVQAILTVLGRLNAKNRDGERINLRRADLRGADLRDLDFQGAILVEARVEGILLHRIILRQADLQRADFRRTVLDDADLRKADLRHADFRGAQLNGADLRCADLTGANFQWGPLVFSPSGIFGSTRNNPALRTELKEADLRGATLRHAHFEGADLSHSSFRRAWVEDASGDLVQDEALFRTVLTDANFQAADIRGADFTGVHGLTQAQVDSAIADESTRLPEYLFFRLG